MSPRSWLPGCQPVRLKMVGEIVPRASRFPNLDIELKNRRPDMDTRANPSTRVPIHVCEPTVHWHWLHVITSHQTGAIKCPDLAAQDVIHPGTQHIYPTDRHIVSACPYYQPILWRSSDANWRRPATNLVQELGTSRPCRFHAFIQRARLSSLEADQVGVKRTHSGTLA